MFIQRTNLVSPIKFLSSLLLVVVFIACGGGGGSEPSQPPANIAPTADAGANQVVDENITVTLSGSGTDSDGSITSYSWSQTAGVEVSISNPDSANASFIAPDIGSDQLLTFELTVTDNEGAIGTDSMDIELKAIVLSSGIYHASNGTNHSVVHDLNMEEPGYIDITNYRSSVSLLDESLIPIFDVLENSNLIEAGNYKVKFTYNSTSLIPGTVSVFGLKFQPYESLDNIESKQYNAVGSLGTYSVYYKFDHPAGGNIDVTTFKASVNLYNFDLYGNDGKPMVDHYEQVSGNTFLDAGSYIVKFTFDATSLTPGSVTFLIGG